MVAAIGATMLMGFLAVFATYYRFVFLLGGVKHFPWGEFAATLVLVFCGTVSGTNHSTSYVKRQGGQQMLLVVE